MSTRVEFIKTWKARALQQLTKLGHASLATQLTFDAYNVNRGKYKALQDLLLAYDDEIKRINGGDDDDAIGEREPLAADDDDFEAPAAGTVRRRQQARQPRSWS